MAAVRRRVVYEQAQAEHARSSLERLLVRNEQRHRLARARNDDALTCLNALEQLRKRTTRVVRVVLSKRLS